MLGHGIFAISLIACSVSYVLAEDVARLPRRPQEFSGVLHPGTEQDITLSVGAGQTCRVHIGDVRAVVKSRTSDLPRTVDGFEFGAETITIIAVKPTNYTVSISEVLPQDGLARYSARIECVGEASETDENRVRAEDLSTRAKSLAGSPQHLTEARLAAKDALSAWQNLNEMCAIGRLHLLLGNLAYLESDWKQAIAEYRDGRDACGLAADGRCEAELNNNIGLAHLKTGEADLAETELEAALGEWQKLRISSAEAATAINLGLLYWQTTEWDSALREYEHARQLVRAPTLQSAKLFNNIGLVYLSMADGRKASMYFSLAIRQTPERDSRSRDYGRMLMNVGRAEMLDGKLRSALHDQQKAIFVLRQARDDSGLADARNNLGQILIRLERFAEAREMLQASLSYYERAHDLRGQSSAFHHLGWIAMNTGDLSQARAHLEHALRIRLERRLNDEAAETAYTLGILALREGNTVEALARTRNALDLIRSVQAHVLGEPLRRSYFSNKYKYASFYVDTALGPDPASSTEEQIVRTFNVAEQFRARSLNDILGVQTPGSNRPQEAAVRARHQSLLRQLNFASHRIATLPDTPENTPEIARLRSEIDRLLAEDNEIVTAVQSNNSGSAQGIWSDEFNIEQFRERYISPTDVILAYSLCANRSFLWTLTRDEVRVTVLPPRTQIEGAVRRYLDLLVAVDERRGDSSKQARFRNATAQLARLLGLYNWSGEHYQRLLVVPDGVLYRVPFSTLPAHFGIFGVVPMGLMLEVAQVPSLTVFQILARRSNNYLTLPRIAVFGDPVYSTVDTRAPRSTGSGSQAQNRNTVSPACFFSGRNRYH